MNAYLRNDESRPCECGGKVAFTPSLKLTHEGTKKHREWLFCKMCVEFLEMSLQEDTAPGKEGFARRVRHLKAMKAIVCV